MYICLSQESPASGSLHEHHVSYRGAQVWQTRLNGESDLYYIGQLADNDDISLWNVGVETAEFLVSKMNKRRVNKYLRSRRMNHTVIIADVQNKIDETTLRLPDWDEHLLRSGYRMNWESYPTLAVINEYFHFISDNFPAVCNVTIIGYSVQEQPIQMVKISNGDPTNKLIMITAGMHAREWAGITSAFYIINEIVTRFDQLPTFMRNKDWYIIPLVNPDGYKYSHTHDRLWRKNMQQSHIDMYMYRKNCKGVDINRNFGFDWNIKGVTQHNSCRETYPGEEPFSEPETKSLRNVLKESTKRPSVFLDIHTFGQQVLHPYGARDAPDDENLLKFARGIAKEIKNTTNQEYETGPIRSLVHPTTGSGIDWFYSEGVPLCAGMEARDKGRHGFLLPPQYIIDTAKDMFVAATYAARAADPEDFLTPTTSRDPIAWFK